MEIIKQTSSELILKNKPDTLAVKFMLMWFIFCLPLSLCIASMSLEESGVTTLNCKRVEPTQVTCEMQHLNFWGSLEELREFSQVKSAELKSKEEIDSDGDRIIYNWVTLVTINREMTLVEDLFLDVKGSANEMQAIATQINNFIQSNQTSLLIQRDDWDLLPHLGKSLSIFAFSLLFSAFLLFLNRSESLIFDKNSGNLIREQKILLVKKRKYYLLYEITGIEIEERFDSDCDKVYELKLLLKPPLYKETLMSSYYLQGVKNMQTTIRDFLQLS
jgi:hypothetical protein